MDDDDQDDDEDEDDLGENMTIPRNPHARQPRQQDLEDSDNDF